MPMPSKSAKIYEEVGAANTAFTTQLIDTADYDNLLIYVLLSGGVAPASLVFSGAVFDIDGVTQLGTFGGRTISTGAGSFTVGAGPGTGAGGSDNMTSANGFAYPLGPNIKFTVPAFGVGITATIRVTGRRQFRGSVPSTNTINGLTPRALD